VWVEVEKSCQVNDHHLYIPFRIVFITELESSPMLPVSVCWSNPLLFRSSFLICSTWAELFIISSETKLLDVIIVSGFGCKALIVSHISTWSSGIWCKYANFSSRSLNYAVANTRQLSCSYFWEFLIYCNSFPVNPFLHKVGHL